MEDKIWKGYEKGADRLELFVRIIYSIAVGVLVWVYTFVISLWAVLISFLVFLHWFYSLFTGKRWEWANKHTSQFVNFVYGRFFFDYMYRKVYPYFFLLTDNRPGFKV